MYGSNVDSRNPIISEISKGIEKYRSQKLFQRSVFSQYSKQNQRCARVNVRCFPEEIVGRSRQRRLSRVVRIKRHFLRRWTTSWNNIPFSWCCKPCSVDGEGPVCFKNVFISTQLVRRHRHTIYHQMIRFTSVKKIKESRRKTGTPAIGKYEQVDRLS